MNVSEARWILANEKFFSMLDLNKIKLYLAY